MTTVAVVQNVLMGGRPLPHLVQLGRQAPFRPPYWRFAAAVQRLKAIDDADIVDVLFKAARLRRIWRGECPDWPASHFAPRRSALQAAVSLLFDSALTRAEIEARLLADQSCEKVAEQMQILPVVVSVFEAFFFCVRPRLRQLSWIWQIVLNPINKFGVYANDDIPLLWKVYGYNYGPLVVDLLTQSLSHAQLQAQGLDGYLNDEVPIPFEMKLAIACARLPLPQTAEQLAALNLLIQLKAMLREAERQIDLAGPVHWNLPLDYPLAIQQRCLSIARSLLRAAA